MATNIDVRKGLKLKTTEGKWFLQRSLAQPQWNDTIWLVLVRGHVGKALDTWSLTGYNAQNKKTPKSKFHCSSSLFVDSIITAWDEVKVFEAREVPLRSASSPRGIGGWNRHPRLQPSGYLQRATRQRSCTHHCTCPFLQSGPAQSVWSPSVHSYFCHYTVYLSVVTFKL